MGINEVLFGFFGLMTVLPVFYLIFTRNVIRAALALVVSLLGVAALFVLLHAEYLAIVQILIYAGGVIVLLIFGIMLTRRINDEGVYTGHQGVFFGVVASAGLLGLLAWLIRTSGLQWPVLPENSMDQVARIGFLFLTDHLIAFEVVAFILLVALVGASYLAKKSSNL